jgi:hypothetical protein
LPLRSIWWWLLSTVAIVRYAATFGVNVFPLGLHSANRLVHATVIAQAILLILYATATIIQGRGAGADPLAQPVRHETAAMSH